MSSPETLKRLDTLHPNVQAAAVGVRAVDPSSLPAGDVVYVVQSRMLTVNRDGRDGREVRTLPLPRDVAAERLGFAPEGDHEWTYRLATDQEVADYQAAEASARAAEQERRAR